MQCLSKHKLLKLILFIVCIYVEVSCFITDLAQKYGGPYWDKGWSKLGSRVLNLAFWKKNNCKYFSFE